MGQILGFLATAVSIVAPFLPFPFNFVAMGIGILAGLSASKAVKPKSASSQFSFVDQARDLTVVVRSSVEPRRIIYGEAKVAGPLVYAEVASRSGAVHTKKFLELIVPLAGHQVQAINDVYFIDSIAWYDTSGNAVWRTIHDSDSDTAGTTNAGALYTLGKHLGADDQAADATLVSRGISWTANHRLRGVAYLWVELREDPGVWTTGIPNISATVQGRLVYDPRATTATITTSAIGTPGIFATSAPHGYVAGDRIFIDSHANSLPAVAKEFQIATVPTTSTFTLLGNDGSGSIGETLAITQAGSGGTASKMLWTDNAALCKMDYLLAPFGFGCDLDEIDTASFIASANTCEEMVTVTDASDTFTAVAATDICTRSTLTVPIRRGDGVQLTTTNTLPAGLSLATTYYYIPTTPTISEVAPNAGQITAFNFKLATSRANALAGTAINITGAGTGVHTITRKSQARYTMDGVITTDVAPLTAMANMLTADAGVLTYTQGTFRLAVGVYSSPVVDLDESDLRGELSIRTKLERKDLFNTVKGTFIDPDNSYQASDFPVIASATFKTEDGGEEIARDSEFPFTNDAIRCQRLAKITLLRARTGGMVVNFPAKLTALRIAPQDTITLTISKLGLSAAPFLVTEWRMSDDLGVDLTLSAVAAGDFTWTAAEAATANRPAVLQLIDASFIPPPGLALDQDTVPTNAGDAVPRLLITITPPASAVIAGYEAEYKVSTDTTYTQIGVGEQLNYQVVGVTAGATYNVRVRSVSGTNAKSTYTTASLEIDTAIVGTTLWDSVPGNIDTWGLVDGL